MTKLNKLSKLALGLCLFGTGLTASAAEPSMTVDPTYVPDSGLWEMTFTFEGTVRILDKSLIYITTPDYVELNGTDGLTVSEQGDNTLLLSVDNGPILNNSAYEAYTYVGVWDGAISIDGVTLENEGYGISREITWAPGGMAIPEPTLSPNKGIGVASTIDKINMSWEGFYVGYSDDYDSWAEAAAKIIIYKEDLNSFDYNYDTPIAVTVTGADSYMDISTRWYGNITLTPAEPLTDPNVKYVLSIPSNTLGFKDMDNGDTVDYYDEPLDFIYTVTGSASITVEPRQYAQVNYNNWKGLVLNNVTAAGVSLLDASKVALYDQFLNSKSEISAASPIATGVQGTSSSDEIVITFNAEMVNGNYTIIVNPGAFSGLSTAANSSNPLWMEGITPTDYMGVHFTLTGNEIDINTVELTAIPSNNSTLEAIENVKVYWGDYLTLEDVNNPSVGDDDTSEALPIAGTMSVNGQSQNIDWYITKEAVDPNADPIVYNYSLVYTPETPITKGGKYVFTIPQNSVIVLVNNQNQLKNQEVVLTYTIESEEEEPEAGTLPEATVLFENEPPYYPVFLYWDEGIEAANEDEALTATLVTPEGTSLDVDLVLTLAPLYEEGSQPGFTYNALVLNMSETIAEYGAGEYSLSVPAGIVANLKGDLNPAQTAKFEVPVQVTVTDVKPEISYNVEDENITIVWDDLEVSVYNPLETDIMIINNENYDLEPLRLSVGNEVTIDGDMVTVDLSKLDLEEGVEYLLTIGENYFYLGESKTVASADINYDFTYGKEGNDNQPEETQPVAVAYTLSVDGLDLSVDATEPTELEVGFTQIDLSAEVALTLAPEDEFGNSPLAFVNIYGVDDPDKMVVAGIDSYKDGVLYLSDPFEAVGTYVLEVADGVFTLNDEPVAGRSFYFTTGEAEVEPVTLFIRGAFNDYAEAGNALYMLTETSEGSNVFSGTFAVGAGEFEFNLQSNEGVVYVFNGEGVAPEGTNEEGEEERPGVMLMPVTFTEGVYNGGIKMALGGEENWYWSNTEWLGGSIVVTVDLTKDTITIESKESSAVASLVDAVDGKYLVYNLNGVLVLNTDKASDLNKLAKGLYIVNGKKVLVK